MSEEIKTSVEYYINLVNMNRKMYERNGIETILDNDGMLRLNEKHIEEGLDQKDLKEFTIKYHYDHRGNRYELVDEPKTMQ